MNADRSEQIRAARVYLAEAGRRRHRRCDRNFYWVLIGWAANCRRRALEAREPGQRELFA